MILHAETIPAHPGTRARVLVWTAMKSVILWLLLGYKRYISPWLPRSCRFEPTCSEYMYQAVERRGVSTGIFLGVKRLLRCHPFCQGGFDPVP